MRLQKVILPKPKFWSNKKFLNYINDNFPKQCLGGWADANCRNYELWIWVRQNNEIKQ